MERSSWKSKSAAWAHGMVLGSTLFASFACSANLASREGNGIDYGLECRPINSAGVVRLTPDQIRATIASILPSVDVATGGISATMPSSTGYQNARVPSSFTSGNLDALVSYSKLVGEGFRDQESFWGTCLAASADSACMQAESARVLRIFFRREATTAEVTHFATRLQSEIQASSLAEAKVAWISSIVLSPSFLLRTEAVGNPADPSLSNLEFAQAISFFVSDLPADEALIRAVEAGEFETEEGAKAQIVRLLQARRGNGLISFLRQHFSLSSILSILKASEAFPSWTPELASDLYAESDRFLQHVIYESPNVRTLLAAPYTFVNARLASHYGLTVPNASNGDFVRVDYPADFKRAGILSQGAIMGSMATPTDTEPVRRGRFIRENILCGKLDPPPANVPLIEASSGARTHRERLAQHRLDPVCAACHNLMDPLGLPFESIAGDGAQRMLENGLPTVTTGTIGYASIPDVNVGDASEMGARLAEHPDARRCLATRMVQYAHGAQDVRGMPLASTATGCNARAVELDFVEDGDLLGLVARIVAHPSFRRRTAP